MRSNLTGGAYAYGGAIYNVAGGFTEGNVTEISGNYAEGFGGAYGGGIYNTSGTFKLDKIGDIINNHVTTQVAPAQGGAIYNQGGNLGVITGAIENNYAKIIGATGAPAAGGAIYNQGGTIEELNATTLKNNYVSAALGGSIAQGGAIYNGGTVNGGTIGEISGNYVESYGYAQGGAIYNDSTNFVLDGITGNITNNHATSEYGDTYGGAIYNKGGNLGKILNDSISDNYIKCISSSSGNSNQTKVMGAAIYNTGTIENLSTKALKNNYAISNQYYGITYGGAIANWGIINGGTIGEISGNYIEGSQSAHGGAIYNASSNFKLNAITGDITNNHAHSPQGGWASGGAIHNDNGTIGNITNNKISDNFAATQSYAADGGAIYNNGNIGNISTKEINNNYTSSINGNGGVLWGGRGGAIYNTGSIKNISANNASNNYAKSYDLYGNRWAGTNSGGGLIYNTSSIGAISIENISNNYTEGYFNAYGGAVYNEGTIDSIKSNFNGNFVNAHYQEQRAIASLGGAIYNKGNIKNLASSSFIGNFAESQGASAQGGAIYNTGKIDGIINSSFLKNYVEGKADATQGGAIWTSKDLDISANGGVSVFKGNYAKVNGIKDDNAIYVGNAEANLNLKQLNNGNMYMFDNIRGEDGYKVNISGDSTGTYYMFNDIYNGNVTMANTTVNTVNNKIHTYDFKSLTVNGNTDFVADVDMANQTMDRFTASSYGNHKGKLNVKDMNFISGSDKDKIEIYFAQKGLKDYVTTSKKEFLTPLYKYGIHYDNREDAGYFVFMRGAGSSNPLDSFNPAVLTSPVATQAGAQASMTNTLYYAFEHGDTFMNFSAMDRFAKINSNTYALAERQGALSTDFNSNLNLDYAHQNKGVWTKPYSSFESIHLKNGPKVDVISYGTLIGFDSDIHKLKRGWANVATAYIGYNGSQVDYSNVDASTNGGLLGLTETFYKGNFWTALTATAGASFAEAHTMYGKDEMTMLMAGIGSKTGYNFEFKEGKFI